MAAFVVVALAALVLAGGEHCVLPGCTGVPTFTCKHDEASNATTQATDMHTDMNTSKWEATQTMERNWR